MTVPMLLPICTEVGMYHGESPQVELMLSVACVGPEKEENVAKKGVGAKAGASSGAFHKRVLTYCTWQ